MKNTMQGACCPLHPLPPPPFTIRSSDRKGQDIGRDSCGTARQPLKDKDGFHASRGPSVFLLARLPFRRAPAISPDALAPAAAALQMHQRKSGGCTPQTPRFAPDTSRKEERS